MGSAHHAGAERLQMQGRASEPSKEAQLGWVTKDSCAREGLEAGVGRGPARVESPPDRGKNPVGPDATGR